MAVIVGIGYPVGGERTATAEVKTKVGTPRGFVEEHGCANASLYGCVHQAGLMFVELPQFAAFDQPQTPQAQFSNVAILGAPSAEEAPQSL